MKTRFLIYGLIGWVAETIYTGFGSLLKGDLTMRAWTYIWMFPIYGLMILLEPIHDRIRNLPIAVRGGIYTVLIFGIEYATGWILRELIGKCPWNYGVGPYTIDGLINLSFIPVWFIGGLIFEKLHDFLKRKRMRYSD
jgi:uncharacterized membrane protein